MMEAAQNLKGSYDIESSTFHIKRLKPLDDLAPIIDEVNRCGAGLVIDSGFESCGLGRDIAYQLMLSTGKPVHTLGMKDTPVGCSEATMNPTPTGDQITAKVLDILGGSN
jgi:pyruvate/2-oxoglutarate/acetoin dehydrogenase E1 component